MSGGMHAVLDLTADPLAFRAPAGEADIALPWSLAALARRVGLAFPPREAVLEASIAEVEDALMPHVPALRARGTHALEVSGATGAAIVALAAGTQAREATLDEVERLFNRLACVAAGRPAAVEGLPEDAGLALALLVLRETLHHVGYAVLRPVQ